MASAELIARPQKDAYLPEDHWTSYLEVAPSLPEFQAIVIALCKRHFDTTKPLSQQSKESIAIVEAKFLKVQPYISKFAGMWPLHDSLTSWLNAMSAVESGRLARDRAERTLMDLDKDDARLSEDRQEHHGPEVRAAATGPETDVPHAEDKLATSEASLVSDSYTVTTIGSDDDTMESDDKFILVEKPLIGSADMTLDDPGVSSLRTGSAVTVRVPRGASTRLRIEDATGNTLLNVIVEAD
ncbi:hypothetical protein FA95DRAFT_1553321 [Auriscalpium vulgare]|uniref:Uncharacterized protein n=1 Tax=Auriscalpium vulgare TaxID=40419 RepID=A0ACB8S830_9AGAM|nr:hypothetical protein FA95DRAFT_1553321 [Auriscalpium vulgare]